MLLAQQVGAARLQHLEREVLNRGLLALGRAVAQRVADGGPQGRREAALGDGPRRPVLAAPQLREQPAHSVAHGVARGVGLGSRAGGQHRQAQRCPACLVEPAFGQGGAALLRVEEAPVVRQRAGELSGHAALGGPDALHLAGERGGRQLHVVEEVVLGARLAAGPVDHQVARGALAQDGALARQLRACHVDKGAAAQVEPMGGLCVLPGLVLPEQRGVPQGELAPYPVLYLFGVYVHGPTSQR